MPTWPRLVIFLVLAMAFFGVALTLASYLSKSSPPSVTPRQRTLVHILGAVAVVLALMAVGSAVGVWGNTLTQWIAAIVIGALIAITSGLAAR